MRKNAIALFGLRILKTIFSVAILSLSAYFFGVSIERDIWILAFNCILILDLAIWGPVNETFRAKFIFLKQQHGEAVALQKAMSLILFTAIVSITISFFIVLFPQVLARIIAPGYYYTHLSVLNFMIRIIVPSFLLNQIIQLVIGILNAYHSFYMPEVANFVSSLINILILFLLAPLIGIYSLVVSYYISLFILFALILYQIKRMKVQIKWIYFQNFRIEDLRPFFILALPFFLPYFVGQINLLGEKSIANLLGNGIVSLIDYSRKFTDIPISALSSVLATILLPVLSSQFSNRNFAKFIGELRRIVQLGLLILTLVIGSLVLNASSIVSILYGGSSISQEHITLIRELLLLYSFSAYSIFLYSICGIALIAADKGKYFAFYGVVAQTLMLGMNFLLFRKLNVFVFPLSLFLSHFVATLFLYPRLSFGRKEVVASIFRYSFFLIATIFFSYLINNFISIEDSPYYSIIIKTSILVMTGIGFVFLMRLEERRAIVAHFKKYFFA